MDRSRFNLVIWRIVVGAIALYVTACIFTFSFADDVPYEFQKSATARKLYLGLIFFSPVAVSLTLIKTIREENGWLVNVCVCIGTLLIALAVFYFFSLSTWMYGFGAWSDRAILYRSRVDSTITIRDQIFDEGALGWGSTRIVKLEPFLHYWYKVEYIDTASINTGDWNFVNEESPNFRSP